MSSFFSLCRDKGLSEDQIYSFGDWAFGEGWVNTPPSSGNDLWNARHSDLLVVGDMDAIDASTSKMIGLWKEAGEP